MANFAAKTLHVSTWHLEIATFSSFGPNSCVGSIPLGIYRSFGIYIWYRYVQMVKSVDDLPIDKHGDVFAKLIMAV